MSTHVLYTLCVHMNYALLCVHIYYIVSILLFFAQAEKPQGAGEKAEQLSVDEAGRSEVSFCGKVILADCHMRAWAL